MAELSAPVARVHRSFLDAMSEFGAEGRGATADATMVGAEIRACQANWSTPAGFEAYLRWLRGQVMEDSPRPDGYVPSTTLWWVDGTEYLGRIAVRHRLTARLRDVRGHIGYDIRPSARRRRHSAALPAGRAGRSAVAVRRQAVLQQRLVGDAGRGGSAAADRG